MIFNVILKDLVENFLVYFFLLKSLPLRIRIHMDIFGILDPDPLYNRCGSATLVLCVYITEQTLIFNGLSWIQPIFDTDPDAGK